MNSTPGGPGESPPDTPTPCSPRLEAGSRRFGDYVLIETLGEGGMGVVYKARHVVLQRLVALKLLKRAPGSLGDAHVTHLLEEARNIAALDHPNIVAVHTAGECDGQPFVEMALVEGTPLARLCALGPLPHTRALRYTEGVARALAHAHERGIVHRDIKPSNILITSAEEVKVVDFGISSSLRADNGASSLEALTGTPAYMAPEQWQRLGQDARTDLYALGITLYEMLYGHAPFYGGLADLAVQHSYSAIPLDPRPDPDGPLPSELLAILLRLTAKRPDDRYSSAKELLSAIGPLLIGSNAQPVERLRPDPQLKPYRGLEAFQPEHAQWFCGRSALVDELQRRLEAAVAGQVRLLTVIGPSGSGKSSLVRAGLIPRLRSWAEKDTLGDTTIEAGVAIAAEPDALVLSPGSRPVEALSNALSQSMGAEEQRGKIADSLASRLMTRDSQGRFDGLCQVVATRARWAGQRLIVLVDQFEEVFTRCEEESAREAFIGGLLHAASVPGGITVILTLRSDFLSRLQAHDRLASLISTQSLLVVNMGREELREAISRPASLAGFPLDPGTIELLLEQATGRTGALPLLQFTLTRIWEGMLGGREPAEVLRDLGGVGGALAGEAERIYLSLEVSQQPIARRAFLRLVHLEDSARDTRRRVAISALTAEDETAEQVTEVLQAFARPGARLVVMSADEAGATFAEVAHEAIFDHWARLREWLVEGRDDLRFGRAVELAALEWDEAGRPSGMLWRAPRLDLLEAYRDRCRQDLSRLQIAFAESCRADEDARRAAEVALRTEERRQQEREHTQNLRLRRRQAVIAFLLVLTLAFLTWALSVRQDVVQERNRAIDQLYVSQLEVIRNQIGRGEWATAAKDLLRLRSVVAEPLSRSFEWKYLAARILEPSASFSACRQAGTLYDFSFAGERLAVPCNGHRMLYSAQDGRLMLDRPSLDRDVAFSGDMKYALLQREEQFERPVLVTLDASGPEVEGLPTDVVLKGFYSDGSLFGQSREHLVRLSLPSLRREEIPLPSRLAQADVWALSSRFLIALHRSGAYFRRVSGQILTHAAALSSMKGDRLRSEVEILDTETGLSRLIEACHGLGLAGIFPDTSLVACSDGPGDLRVFDPRDDHLFALDAEPYEQFTAFGFLPHENLFVAAGSHLVIWSLVNGSRILSLRLPSHRDVAVSASGRYLALLRTDRTTDIMDLRGMLKQLAPLGEVEVSDVFALGNTGLWYWRSGRLRLASSMGSQPGSQELGPLPRPDGLTICDAAADCLAASGKDGTTVWQRLTDSQAPTPVHIPGNDGVGRCPELAIDHGRWLARGCEDGSLLVNPMDRLHETRSLARLSSPVIHVRFIRNNRLLAVARDGTGVVWSLADRAELGRFALEGAPADLDVSPSGLLLAAIVQRSDQVSELQLRLLPEGRLLARRSTTADICLELLNEERLLLGGAESLTVSRTPDLLQLATLEELESPWASQWGQKRLAYCPLEVSPDGRMMLHGFKRRSLLRNVSGVPIPQVPFPPPPLLPANPDFEVGSRDACPQGWTCDEEPIVVTDACGRASGRCAQVDGPEDGDGGFTNLMQRIAAFPYRGRQIRLSAFVKVRPDADGRAQLWIRADRFRAPPTGLFDNMEDRPIRDPEWNRYEILGRVDDAADQLSFGLMTFGTGTRAWVDELRLEILPEADQAGPRR